MIYSKIRDRIHRELSADLIENLCRSAYVTNIYVEVNQPEAEHSGVRQMIGHQDEAAVRQSRGW